MKADRMYHSIRLLLLRRPAKRAAYLKEHDILGAIGEPDIGYWFPPNDDSCLNICSLRIVEKAVELLHAQGGKMVNADCALIAEAPKIMPFVQQMKETLAPILGVSPKRVGVKATTNEKLGALGRREGMAAFATVAIQLPE